MLRRHTSSARTWYHLRQCVSTFCYSAVDSRTQFNGRPVFRLSDFHDKSLSRGPKLSRRAVEERAYEFLSDRRCVCRPLSRGSSLETTRTGAAGACAPRPRRRHGETWQATRRRNSILGRDTSHSGLVFSFHYQEVFLPAINGAKYATSFRATASIARFFTAGDREV